MAFTDDNTGLDEQAQEVRGRGKASTGGASIQVRDPRVSRAIGWGMGIFGSALLIIGTWIASSINSLNVTMAKVLTQNEAFLKRQDVHESEINQLQRDVATLEGKVFRGVDGYRNGN